MARSEVDPCDHADEGNNSSNMENSEETGALVVRDRPDDEDGDTNGPTSEERKSEEQQLQPQQQQPQQQLPSKWESFASVAKSLIIRSLIIFFVVSYFRKPQTDPASPQGQAPARIQASNIFHNGTLFDLYVYLSEDESFRGFNDPKTLIWSERELIYGDWYGGENGDGSRELEYAFVPSSKLKNNGSIYLHVYVTRHGKLPNPEAGKDKYSKNDVAYARRMLNKFKKIKYEKKHNLLTGETTASEEAVKKAEIMQQEIVSHWHPNMTINLVTDQTNWVFGQIPPPIDTYFEFLPGHRYYKPVIYLNDFWNMQRDYKPLNDSVEELTLRLTYKPISLLKWEIYAAQQSTRQKWLDTFLGDTTEDDDSDQDTLKETLLDTNPYLLGMTFAVSILHSIFEFLAFKNDIEFWNNRQSLEGLSVRSVFFNVFQSLVVLLYVLDNATNTVVRISCMVGLAIEIWKINKVVDIRVNRERKILGIFPSVSFHDKGSYVESSTKKYDRLAFEYLSWALYPLLGGYAVYSLMYLEHKGWYSWVLSMLYGFLLTFGFIMMTPQLFINYKLKSVAHLPWRMMSYKFFNTFIDDIFAFVIKMPTLYRLGCFRDDIVFFIFLYQRWIYKTDHTRVNEFGFSGEMEAKLAAEKRQKAIAAPVPETNSAKAESSKKTD